MNSVTQKAIAIILGGAGAFSTTYIMVGPKQAPAPAQQVVTNDNPLRIRTILLDPSAEPTPDPTESPTPSPEPEPSLSPTPSPTPSDAGGNTGGGGIGNGGIPPTSPPASPKRPRLP